MRRIRSIQDMVAVRMQLRRERQEAQTVVQRLSETLATIPDEKVPDAWRTVGFVQELSTAAAAMQEKKPSTAVALAHLAIAVAAMIREDQYPPVVIAEAEAAAWRELANGHRYMSRYDAALKALDAADRVLEPQPALGFDRAMTDFARAVVLSDLHRFDEADAFLAASEGTFAEYHDRKRQGDCLLLRGINEHRRGNLAMARSAYQAAIVTLRKAGDAASLAAAYNNLAHAESDLGHYQPAAEALQKALAIFGELGATGEVARAKWVLGRILIGSERYLQARDVLLEARRMLIALKMPEEAGLAGLELAEVFITLRDPFRAVAIVEEIVGEFRHAGLNERASTAVAYLRDLIETTRGRDAVRHVRAYVARLKQQPTLAFAPLPD